MQKQTIDWLFLLGAALLISWTTLLVGNAMINADKNNQQTAQGITNTISVMGEGKDLVSPDILVINLSISELATTTKEAQSKANTKVAAVTALLKAAEIAEKDIKTTNANVYPEYDRKDSWRKLLWYRAQQSISIQVGGEDFGQKGANILDKISAIGGINIDNSYFDLKDRNLAMQWAREKALNDAKAKAEQLAKASGITLGKPVMITDNNYWYNPGPMYYGKVESVWAGSDSQTPPALSPGQTEVTVNVNVLYEIK